MITEMTTPWLLSPDAFATVERAFASSVVFTEQALRDRRAGRGERESPLSIENGVAEIPVSGVMTKGMGLFQLLFGGYSTGELTQAVQAAAADPSAGAILLRIDSPGGSTAGLAELSDAVYAARKAKPVVAQVEGMAASAAYRIASQAEAIYAHRADRVGSIGTIVSGYDESRKFEEEGVKPVIVTTGPMKAVGFPGAPVTEEQRAYLQRTVDAIQADFDAELRRGRKLTDRQLEKVKTGEVWQAGEALTLRLIDAVQTTDRTRADLVSRVAAAQRAGRSSARQMTPAEARRVAAARTA